MKVLKLSVVLVCTAWLATIGIASAQTSPTTMDGYLQTATLANFIQNFEKIPLRDENFEFPDLLGAA